MRKKVFVIEKSWKPHLCIDCKRRGTSLYNLFKSLNGFYVFSLVNDTFSRGYSCCISFQILYLSLWNSSFIWFNRFISSIYINKIQCLSVCHSFCLSFCLSVCSTLETLFLKLFAKIFSSYRASAQECFSHNSIKISSLDFEEK